MADLEPAALEVGGGSGGTEAGAAVNQQVFFRIEFLGAGGEPGVGDIAGSGDCPGLELARAPDVEDLIPG